MFSSQVASILALFLASQASAAELVRPIARSNDGRGVISALLRTSQQVDASDISRRASCGYAAFACEDGTGCCPIGDYCGEWDGLLGCCPIGRICGNSEDDPCNHSGYNVCAGDYFCCPAGGLCGRTSSNKPKCLDKYGNSASVVYTGATTATATKTSTSHRTTTTTWDDFESTTSTVLTGLPTITPEPSSPTVYTFESTTITGPLLNGGDATTSSSTRSSATSISQTTSTTTPASGLLGGGNGAMAITASASVVVLSLMATLLVQY